MNENCIMFSNTKPIPGKSWFTRLAKRFYRTAGTYELSYWFGNTGTVTLGPDFLHFHILFALRPTSNGKTEGQTVLLTKRRSGIVGRCITWVVLRSAQIASSYFAHGDTKIFRSIKFNMQTPVKADKSIIRFIQHLEKQIVADWGFSQRENIESERLRVLSVASGNGE